MSKKTNSEVLQEIFRHNLWANQAILEACKDLDDELLDAESSTGVGSIRETLLHIAANEEGYVALVAGDEPSSSLRDFDEVPGFDVIGERLFGSGTAFIDLADQLDAETTVTATFEDAEWQIRAMVPLIQAINHGTEHREQIKSMMTAAGITPPTIDLWAYSAGHGYLQMVG